MASRFNGSIFGKLNPKRTSNDGTHGGIYSLNFISSRQDTEDGWDPPPAPGVRYLIQAGGGGGGNGASGYPGGGGGAGALKTNYGSDTQGGGQSTGSAITVPSGNTITVTVGAGGSSETAGSNSQISFNNK